MCRPSQTVGGAPKEIRTPSLLIRSQVLYPVELWVRTQQRERQPNQLVADVQAAFSTDLLRRFFCHAKYAG